MKKLLFIFAALMVAISLQAQDYTGKIKPGQSFKESIMTTTLTNTDTVDVQVATQVNYPFTLDVAMAVDSISGDPSGTLYVEGRKHGDLTWTAIANTVWGGADSTVVVSHTTAVRYRELRARFISGGTGVVDADKYWFKIWYE